MYAVTVASGAGRALEAGGGSDKFAELDAATELGAAAELEAATKPEAEAGIEPLTEAEGAGMALTRPQDRMNAGMVTNVFILTNLLDGRMERRKRYIYVEVVK